MRSLLVIVLLVVSGPGCCCPAPAPCADISAYRAYTPGYSRPCYPAYRPISSAASP